MVVRTQDEAFDPDQSSTAKKLGCTDPQCNCGSPSCQCNENRCYYSRTYGEPHRTPPTLRFRALHVACVPTPGSRPKSPPALGRTPDLAAERSSSEGWLVEDDFRFPDAGLPVRLVFGCENGETGEIFRQKADGIMGMGNNHNAIQSQVRGGGGCTRLGQGMCAPNLVCCCAGCFGTCKQTGALPHRSARVYAKAWLAVVG